MQVGVERESQLEFETLMYKKILKKNLCMLMKPIRIVNKSVFVNGSRDSVTLLSKRSFCRITMIQIIVKITNTPEKGISNLARLSSNMGFVIFSFDKVKTSRKIMPKVIRI